MKKILAFGLLCLWTAAAPVAAEVYDIDTEHSSISFKIRHLFAKTEGSFNTFEGTLEMQGEDLQTFSAQATLQVGSIDTDNEKRDEHLKSPDFFDVAQYPVITFKSTGVKSINGGVFQLTGILSMHGIEKEITLDMAYHGAGPDPWGNYKNGFSASTRIDRKDFGIIWNKAVDNGGVILGDDVEITVELEGTRRAPVA